MKNYLPFPMLTHCAPLLLALLFSSAAPAASLTGEEQLAISGMIGFTDQLLTRTRQLQRECGARATEECRNRIGGACGDIKGADPWLLGAPFELSKRSRAYYQKYCAPHLSTGSPMLTKANEARARADRASREEAETDSMANSFAEQGLAACSAYWQHYSAARLLYKETCSFSH